MDGFDGYAVFEGTGYLAEAGCGPSIQRERVECERRAILETDATFDKIEPRDCGLNELGACEPA